MRVALVAAADNLHTIRWANGLAELGLEIHLVSAHAFSDQLDPRIHQHKLLTRPPLGYFANAPQLHQVLKKISPEIINPHYASGYGTLARLSRARRVAPLILSVWGSDVFDFPKVSSWQGNLIKNNLAYADAVCSISHVMAKECLRVCPMLENLHVVPWGVDTSIFNLDPTEAPEGRGLVIGTVKTLHPKYGVDTLIEAFSICRNRLLQENNAEASKLRLRLVGGGPQQAELVALVSSLKIESVVDFVGPVPHSEVVRQLAELDIYVAASRLDSESFGVAIVEALACRRPVIVSDAGGLPEVVKHEETGLVVPREDATALANAMVRLVVDAPLRKRLATCGRKDVCERFEWSANVAQMSQLYQTVARNCNKQLSAA